MSDSPSTDASEAPYVWIDVSGEDRLRLVDLIRGLEAEAGTARAQLRELEQGRAEDVLRHRLLADGLQARAAEAEKCLVDTLAAEAESKEELRRELESAHHTERAALEEAVRLMQEERDNLLTEVERLRSQASEPAAEAATPVTTRPHSRWRGQSRR